MVVGESKRTANIMDGIENTGDVRLHDHRLRLKQRFDIVRKLGQGTYGKVQLGINKKTGQEVAIKTIKKCKIETEADLIRIRREVQIMSSVRHPNIVHIYEVFENSEKMILVMEYCSGGELYDYLSQKKVLEEDEARRLFRQIATAVYYCHIHKICHRDLKLENVLLDDTGSAKIADFGLSNVFKETSLLSTFCGSPLYASPEIVKGTPYIGPEVDCWSLGVLLYTLVYGAMPFDGSNFKRLVRQISNGDYYEPKNPSSASPLIRDMLTVDPLKRADIAYICDNPWVNMGCETSCLEMAEALAAETPVRLDLLLSLAPAAPSSSNSVVVPAQTDLGPEESCTDLTSSTSMAVEPSNSAEKRILELVAEGGEDAIKPSPTRTLVSAADNKRKYDAAMSASGLLRKKERVASCASVAPLSPALPEEDARQASPPPEQEPEGSLQVSQPTLKSSATMTISPAPTMPLEPVKETPAEIVTDVPKEEEPKEKPKPKLVIKKKPSPPKTDEKTEKLEESKQVEEPKPLSVSSTADKLTSLTLAQPAPAAPAAPTAPAATAAPAKPKKLSIGGHVGSFKEQFERRASLTTAPDIKRNLSKPISKIAKPKAQSEDRELTLKSPDNGTVRLQQIGIEPAPSPQTPMEEMNRGGVKKTESEPSHSSVPLDPNAVLQDARRSLQNSMAKLVEERAGEDNRRRAARDIISTAIRTGKPPVPYGRSSSAGVASLASPPGTPPAPPASAPPLPSASSPRVFRTEALHTIKDHRNRGVSVERIIPIMMPGEEAAAAPRAGTLTPVTPGTPLTTPPASVASPAATARITQTPLRRLASTESTGEAVSPSTGEPIKKSAREFIIPIAVEGKGYVTPRQRSLEPEQMPTRLGRSTAPRPRRISSLVSGGESEEEDDTHMHRLRSTRAARAESVSSGEEDEEDEGFHLLTADNLFSTLLHRVRALTQRLNGEEGPGFQHHPHSIFNNLQSPFFNSPHLPRRHLLREGWGSRELHAPFDSMFNKARSPMPRGNSKKTVKHQTRASQTTDAADGLDLSDLDLSSIEFSEREMQALSGLTPALSRRLQRQLLAHLPPQAAARLRRTLSLHAAAPAAVRPPYARSHSASARSSDDAAAPPGHTQHPQHPQNPQHPPPDYDNDPIASDSDIDRSTTTKRDRLRIDTDIEDQKSKTIDLPEEVDASVDVQTPEKFELPNNNNSEVDMKTSEEVQHSAEIESSEEIRSTDEVTLSTRVSSPEVLSMPTDITRFKSEDSPISASQFCTLPRLRRRSTRSRESVSPTSTSDFDYGSTKLESFTKESVGSKSGSIRRNPDRPLLSKYLAPERNLSLDDSYSSDTGSILSEPSYIAAYGSPAINNTPGLGFRRHSLRLTGDHSKKRISRFLRSDFFDTSVDDSIYAKHKKEKELETQKILKEIRDKKNKTLESTPKSPIETLDDPGFKDDYVMKKCLSPVGNLLLKDRSRSTTPFFPILDNIKESTLDSNIITSEHNQNDELNVIKQKPGLGNNFLNKDSKMIRPKSYPLKNFDGYEDTKESVPLESCKNPDNDIDDKKLHRESKLLRPKSYPTSSPSPEKVYVNRNIKKDETKSKENIQDENKTDVEVSFSITLPKKAKASVLQSDSQKKVELIDQKVDAKSESKKGIDSTLTLRKYQVVSGIDDKTEKSRKVESQLSDKNDSEGAKNGIIREEIKSTISENQSNDKKGTVKKKIIKKVSSKSKTELNASDAKSTDEKKKVTKKVKEKVCDENTKNIAPKKKSMFQSIGQKLEKLAKSSSPEKNSNNVAVIESMKINRTQRENSVPVNIDPPTESNLIKRAVTVTDVAALESQNSQNKTTVSKVFGLFKKFEPKEKIFKSVEKADTETGNVALKQILHKNDNPVVHNLDSEEKPKRPTSLLLNGLSRKNRYSRTSSDEGNAEGENEDLLEVKKENDSKNNKNPLKLDFSRLPRVKKIVPTSPVIEPQIMNCSDVENNFEKKCLLEKNGSIPDSSIQEGSSELLQNRSRSRSRSTYSYPEVKSESSDKDKYSIPDGSTHHLPLRSLDSITPEKEDIVDRIRRKSFYPRFNEKKQRRKSSLVGPGATEYDPLARIHSHSNDSKYDRSPTSPGSYDLSPGLSIGSDMSPSTERYRSLLTDLPTSRSSLRYDGINDKIDMYRSLDRNDFRKHPGRSYLDSDQPSYSSNRYARTKSLFDSSDNSEDQSFGLSKESHKYNRANSLFSPGSYATYRPKRTRNSAIILKESEKEPSPENILDKIRQRKISISVTRKSDSEKEPVPRSHLSPKGESDCSERSPKID